MLYANYTEELTGLKDILIKSLERGSNFLHIHVQMHQRVHKCPCCNHSTSKVHDYRVQRIKDVSAFGLNTIIFLNKRRHVCPSCGK